MTHDVLVATSRLYATTTTIVVHHDRVLLVDLALFPDELAAVAADVHPGVDDRDGRRHARPLGPPAVGGPCHGTPRRLPSSWTDRSCRVARRDGGGPRRTLAGRDRRGLRHGGSVRGRPRSLVGPEARLVVHDAPARGHTAVWLPDQGVLFAGDMLSDVEIPLLDLTAPDPVGGYRAGLERLAGLDVCLIVPGHGRSSGAAAYRRRLAADRRYLDAVGSGRQPADPRLADSALRREHEHALATLAHRHRSTL